MGNTYRRKLVLLSLTVGAFWARHPEIRTRLVRAECTRKVADVYRDRAPVDPVEDPPGDG